MRTSEGFRMQGWEQVKEETEEMLKEAEMLKLENDAKEGYLEAKAKLSKEKKRKKELSPIGQFFKEMKGNKRKRW